MKFKCTKSIIFISTFVVFVLMFLLIMHLSENPLYIRVNKMFLSLSEQKSIEEFYDIVPEMISEGELFDVKYLVNDVSTSSMCTDITAGSQFAIYKKYWTFVNPSMKIQYYYNGDSILHGTFHTDLESYLNEQWRIMFPPFMSNDFVREKQNHEYLFTNLNLRSCKFYPSNEYVYDTVVLTFTYLKDGEIKTEIHELVYDVELAKRHLLVMIESYYDSEFHNEFDRLELIHYTRKLLSSIVLTGTNDYKDFVEGILYVNAEDSNNVYDEYIDDVFPRALVEFLWYYPNLEEDVREYFFELAEYLDVMRVYLEE